MTSFLNKILGLSAKPESEMDDFSAFFTKTSGDKAKVIRQVLREANEEQRKVMKTYKETSARR